MDEIKADSESAIAIGPFGSRMKADCYVEQGIPVIRGNNISDTKALSNEFVFVSAEKAKELTSSNVRDGDLVFPHRGLIGEVGLVTGGPTAHYVLSTSLMKLTLNRKIADPLFFFYFFRSPAGRHELLKNSSQVGTPGIATPLASLRSIRCFLPALIEQRAIAQVLGTLDDKIELNRRMNETLEAMARAIFKSWFLDFDPVKRNQARKRGEIAPSAEASAKEDALFPDSFQDSPLGNIPKGWSVASLADVAALNPETWTKDTAPDHIEYLDLSNARWGRIETTTPYPWKEAPSRAQRVLRWGDTILGTVRPGNGSYAFIANDGLTGSTGFAVLRPRKSGYREIVYLGATAPGNIERLAHLADGAAYPAVRPDIVASTQIVKAPDAIIGRFGSVVGPLLDRVAANHREFRTLTVIRDALLPKLISGEIRLRDAGRPVEAAR